jgi:hypothetical protein
VRAGRAAGSLRPHDHRMRRLRHDLGNVPTTPFTKQLKLLIVS